MGKDMMIQAFGKDKGEIGDLEIEVLKIAGPYPRIKDIFKEMDTNDDQGISINELKRSLMNKREDVKVEGSCTDEGKDIKSTPTKSAVGTPFSTDIIPMPYRSPGLDRGVTLP